MLLRFASLAFAVIVGCAQIAHAAEMPQFEVDKAWPKVPAKWKLGDVSSIAIDAQDNVHVLHRPRTLKPEEVAAPPVVVLDPAGNFIRAWGGEGAGYEWIRSEEHTSELQSH